MKETDTETEKTDYDFRRLCDCSKNYSFIDIAFFRAYSPIPSNYFKGLIVNGKRAVNVLFSGETIVIELSSYH